MKKLLLSVTFITLLIIKSYSQVDSSTTNHNNGYTGNMYALKAKNQKTAAWVLFGGGATLTAIGIASFPKNYDIIFGNNPEKDASASIAALMVVTGTLSMLGSIPVFIVAGNNRFRARLTMAIQKTGPGVPAKLSRNIPGATLAIPLGN